MCLAVFNWQPATATPFMVVANRDEFRQRPTAAMHWWPDAPLLAGKDLQAGGSWLGFNKTGRFALLTNIREGYLGQQSLRSRGELVTRFLSEQMSIEQYHGQICDQIDQYSGFNLLLGEPDRLFWFSSDVPQGEWLTPGIHALSNGALNTPWPKAELAKQQMQAQHALLAQDLTGHTILHDQQQAHTQLLPQTGVPPEWEKKLSAQTITGSEYGTRSRTHAVIDSSGFIRIAEQQIDESGQVSSMARFDFPTQPG